MNANLSSWLGLLNESFEVCFRPPTTACGISSSRSLIQLRQLISPGLLVAIFRTLKLIDSKIHNSHIAASRSQQLDGKSAIDGYIVFGSPPSCLLLGLPRVNRFSILRTMIVQVFTKIHLPVLLSTFALIHGLHYEGAWIYKPTS
jgi:hypothetical protein